LNRINSPIVHYAAPVTPSKERGRDRDRRQRITTTNV